MVVSDGQSTDVEVGVGSDEECSLMDSPVSCAVVQGGGCVVQCSMQNEMVGGMCHNWFPRIRKGTQEKSDLAQPPGQALSHQVSDSDRGWFTGVSL